MAVSLSVIVPFFNEEGAIVSLYQDICSVVSQLGRPYELIFINDGSQDGTARLLEELVKSDPHLIVIHLALNYGQTAAMMAGIDYSSGEVIVMMDGDGQNDTESIPSLLAKIEEGYDVVSGWRKERQDSFLSRRLPSLLANKLISFVAQVPLHDYGCSLKAYRGSFLKEIHLYGEMHRFIPIYAQTFGARIAEVPVGHFPRLAGKSKYGIGRTFKVLLDLMVVKFLQSYLTKPIYIMGGFGLFCLTLGGVAFSVATYLKLFKGICYIQTPLPLAAITAVLFGGVSLLIGLLGEILVRTYYESQNKRTYSVRSCLRGSEKKGY
ncbi:MAG: glycosyltransferase family 2 protein [Holosporales bacterium]|nr:glycosyltransferase family 2 protein [Holosporales bacterium]